MFILAWPLHVFAIGIVIVASWLPIRSCASPDLASCSWLREEDFWVDVEGRNVSAFEKGEFGRSY